MIRHGIRRIITVTVVPLCAVVFLTLPAPAAEQDCPRIVAVGDLHGAYEPFVAILQRTGLISEEEKWIGGDACLVQLGDLVDRGPESRRLIDLLMRLQRTAPGQVHVLMGNHEAMHLAGDLRYIEPEEVAAFSDDVSQDLRESEFKIYRNLPENVNRKENSVRVEFEERFPPGWFARINAFSPEGKYGKWVLGLPVVLKLEGTVFVHAGLTPEDAQRGIDEINRSTRDGILAFLTIRDRLVGSGLLHRYEGLKKQMYQLKEYLSEMELKLADAATAGERFQPPPELPDALQLLILSESDFLRQEGPLWYRDLSREPTEEVESGFEVTLRELDARRMVIAHTPRKPARIESRFGDRLFLIDTGAGPAYKGRISALEISDNLIKAVYLDEQEVLVGDRTIEQILREGEIVSIRDIGSGITAPRLIVLQHEGLTRRAAFKTYDVRKPGLTHLKDGAEFNFTDRYQYEVAAYRIDRMLGLNRVPVAVIRTINGETGVLVDWIEDAINGKELKDRDLTSRERACLAGERALMVLFDTLIANTDRNLMNRLYTPEDGRLRLIDHTRAFRVKTTLPDRYVHSLDRIPRDLYARLKGLEFKQMQKETGDILSRSKIKSILKRRDLILEKIDADLEKYGPEVVFTGE